MLVFACVGRAGLTQQARCTWLMSAASKRETSSIPANEIRAALARLLESDLFQRSPRLSDFLKYIVDMTLEGSAKQLKGYTIGVEVFGKPDSFDPEHDASVRVDATRLRRVLATYYSGQGRNDPVKISVATGTYVPSFKRQSRLDQTPGNRVVAVIRKMSVVDVALAAFSLVVIGAVSGIIFYTQVMGFGERHATLSLESQLEAILKRPAGATVAILPLKPLGPGDTAELADGFDHQLLNDLTRFKSLRMLGRETVKVFSGYNLSPYEIATRLNANYVVEGSLQRSGEKTRIEVRLLEMSTGTYTWSYASEENIRPDNLFHIQTKIIGEIAARLGQPYGVVQRMETRRLKGNVNKTLIPYKCVLAHYAYARNRSAAKHARMRDCLENAVKETPDYTEAWALLSWIYGDEIRYGYNLISSVEDALRRSENAAKKALKINPESARAHQYASLVALLKKDLPGARRNMKIALALNPNDADILADAGWTYTQLGDWELGKSLVEKAVWLNPGHPPWYHGILFAYYYHQKNYERALTHALAYYQPQVLLSSVARAAVNGKLDRTAAANEAANHLKTEFPKFVVSPRSELSGWNFPEAFLADLLDGLRDAGLMIGPTG